MTIEFLHPAATPTSETVPAGSIKNGNLAFFGPNGNTMMASQSAPAETASAVGCPSDSWSTAPTSTFFTMIDLQVQQPPGTTIIDCTAGNGTTALTGTFTLSCH